MDIWCDVNKLTEQQKANQERWSQQRLDEQEIRQVSPSEPPLIVSALAGIGAVAAYIGLVLLGIYIAVQFIKFCWIH